MGIKTHVNYIVDDEKIISILKVVAKKIERGLTLQDFRKVGAYLLVKFTFNMKPDDELWGHLYYSSFLKVFNKEFESKYLFLLDPIIRYNVDSKRRFTIKCYVPRYALKIHIKGEKSQFTWYYALMIETLPEIGSHIYIEEDFNSRWCFWGDTLFKLANKARNNRFFKYSDVLPFVQTPPLNETLNGLTIIPTKKDLQDIINNSKSSHKKDFITYEDWKNGNTQLAIDKKDYCELIEYLRYVVYVLYKKIWDVQRRVWILEPKVFKVNKFISVELRDEKTNIYVNDLYFGQCKRLLFNLPVDNLEEYDNVKSIDDMAMKHPELAMSHMIKISPEDEFWGHCSNLQAWVENDYDTRIIHSNLAFPLLKMLASAGDIKAKRAFKEEIALRFESGIESTRIFLVNQGFLNYLDKEELQLIAEKVDDFENWICFQMIKECSNWYGIGRFGELDNIPFLNYKAYLDLLSNLADLGYSLCKKRVVEIILSLVGAMKLGVLVTTVERYIRHFYDTDIDQLIQAIKDDFASRPPKDFEIKAFKTFLKTRIAVGNQRVRGKKKIIGVK